MLCQHLSSQSRERKGEGAGSRRRKLAYSKGYSKSFSPFTTKRNAYGKFSDGKSRTLSFHIVNLQQKSSRVQSDLAMWYWAVTLSSHSVWMCMHELDCAWSLPVFAIKALERTAGGGGIPNDGFEFFFLHEHNRFCHSQLINEEERWWIVCLWKYKSSMLAYRYNYCHIIINKCYLF